MALQSVNGNESKLDFRVSSNGERGSKKGTMKQSLILMESIKLIISS